jgi:hypothetical protein
MAKIGNPLKVRESNNLEFWLSNLFIIGSTVLGVYLAAQVGYRSAVEFETVRSEREGYYMRRALLEELKDNLEQADKLSDLIINKDGWRYTGTSADPFKLQGYVWETMKQQSTTFQLPVEILNGVRRYYDAAAGAALGMAQGQSTAIEAAKTLTEETKKVREATVPVLQKNIDTLRARLEAKQVALD